MKVLVIGGGGREHAMGDAVRRAGATLYAAMPNENPGLARASTAWARLADTDAVGIAAFARAHGVELAVCGPEAPLAAGVTDALRADGVRVASPSKAAGRIETDKAWMRALLSKHDVGGQIRYRSFDSPDTAGMRDFIREAGPVAVKPVGLTGGKGVQLMGEHLATEDEAVKYALSVFERGIGGGRVVLEEKLNGEEFTLQAFTDGRRVIPTPLVQDHKRAYEGDRGPNTGGMGSYSDADGLLPFVTAKDRDAALGIVEAIVRALAAEGCPYVGTVYGQFMLTRTGPRVIEVNARFGDPEAMNTLSILESSYVDLLAAMADGDVSARAVRFAPRATVCKYLVPPGYGTTPKAGEVLRVDEPAIDRSGARLYYAAVNAHADGVATTTSRALGLVGMAPTIEKANEVCDAALAHVRGDFAVRRDIGTPALIQRRVDHMRQLRGA